jgi:hypothetical protein
MRIVGIDFSQRYLEVPIEWGVVIRMYRILCQFRDESYVYPSRSILCPDFLLYGSAIFVSYR